MAILVSAVLLLTMSTISPYSIHWTPSTTRPRGITLQPSQLARSFTTYPYDEQVGVTFTQSFSSLEFNVTAIAQTGTDGAGPAYLLNGLTDQGYWYQVGVSYNWPYQSGGTYPGFAMIYEVFDPSDQSIFPSGGGGLQQFRVSSGDVVLLSLSFSSDGYVIMQAKDWNTGSIVKQQYSAFGPPTSLD